MAVSAIPFKACEAVNLRGRRVRLLGPFGRFYAGMTGTVADMHPYREGYVVEVQFDSFHPGELLNFEYFTKDDYNEFLIEC